MAFQPFHIQIADTVLADLRERLERTRWTDCIENSRWDYGTDIDSLRRLVEYWKNEFDWRKEEARINTFPQFLWTIDDLRIHFIHLRSNDPESVPLILNHGWPGSFVEHLKLARVLQDHFHIVIPSLPGYGFSTRPQKPGMNTRKIAQIWLKLMQALGYDRFISQGGDWGASVSTWLALDAPESTIGIHLNYIPGSYQPFLNEGEHLTDAEKEFLKNKEEWLQEKGGYAHLQATRPQTLAYAMNDSPVGLAAWILEKVHGWSYCKADVFEHFALEDVLSNIMIYWVTETFGSSTRLYYESRKSGFQLQPGQRVNVPTAVARFANEEPMPPREWVARAYNLVRWTEYPAGSHYAPLEVPELLGKDVRDSATLFADRLQVKS